MANAAAETERYSCIFLLSSEEECVADIGTERFARNVLFCASLTLEEAFDIDYGDYNDKPNKYCEAGRIDSLFGLL